MQAKKHLPVLQDGRLLAAVHLHRYCSCALACTIPCCQYTTDLQCCHMLQTETWKKFDVLGKISMHCSRGPQDNSKLQARAGEEEAGKRMDRKGLGLSIRVGCTVHFALRVQPDTPDLVEVL